MGQHKYNPNCQLAREGKLPPKPKKMSKRESERLLYAKCQEILYRAFLPKYEPPTGTAANTSVPTEKGGKKMADADRCVMKKNALI